MVGKWVIRSMVFACAVLILALGAGLLFGGVHTGAGEVSVVRNGGPYDDNRIREVLPRASGYSWAGWWSDVHQYTAQQRFFTITSDPKRASRAGTDLVTVPTSDGVEVGLEGTLYFTLATDEATIRAFDERYGNRTYLSQDGESHYPYDGDDGWTAFFTQTVRPIVYSTLRAEIGKIKCVDLLPGCSFVEQGAAGANVTMVAGNATAVLAKAETAVNAELSGKVRNTLGGDYLRGFRLDLARVTLPEAVRVAVDKAQAAFADVATAQAAKIRAQAESDANRARQAGYAACPTCAEIDKVKALPQGLTVYAPGGASSLSLPSK